jgi:hypothetical protein
MQRILTLALAIPALAIFATAQTDTSQRKEESHSTTTQSSSSSATSTMAGEPKEFTGTLVDATCGAGVTGAARRTETTTTGSKTTEKNSTSNSSGSSSSSADRSERSESSELHRSADRSEKAAPEHWGDDRVRACPATATTMTYGLVTSGGRFLRLDSAGNNKMSEAWRNNAKWSQNAGRGPNVTVSGRLEGDTLRVDSIR